MYSRCLISFITVLIASDGALAAKPNRLPKGLPPLSAEAVARAVEEGDSSSEWTIALTMYTETWHTIKDVMPRMNWPRIERKKINAVISWGTRTLPMGDPSKPALCRVVDLGGKPLGRDQVLKRLTTKKPVMLSVSGRMPEACYVRLAESDTLIVMLGPGDADAASKQPPPPVAGGPDKVNHRADPKSKKRENDQDDWKKMGEKESRLYLIELGKNTKNTPFSSKEEALDFMHGIWRLDKRAHIGGGHYVRADRGDDMTVICMDEWFVERLCGKNQADKSTRCVDDVYRLKNSKLDPPGAIKVGSFRYRRISEDHMSVTAYDFCAVIQRMKRESLEPVAAAISDPSQGSVPSVNAKDLDDLEAKLKADPQYMMRLLAEGRDKAEALLRAGQKQRPGARLWALDVQMLFAVDAGTGKSLQGKEKVAHFKHALEYLQESYDVAVQALDKSHDERLQAELPGLQIDLALAALEAGQVDSAKKHAAETLRKNTDRKNWNYGNIIHNANQILGRCALREGKLADAKTYLLKAGATPGSPQLNSFGPQMQLARELLEKGEKETVLQYLDLVARFWANPDERTEANSKRTAREHLNQLEAWKRQLRAGDIPDHAKWK